MSYNIYPLQYKTTGKPNRHDPGDILLLGSHTMPVIYIGRYQNPEQVLFKYNRKVNLEGHLYLEYRKSYTVYGDILQQLTRERMPVTCGFTETPRRFIKKLKTIDLSPIARQLQKPGSLIMPGVPVNAESSRHMLFRFELAFDGEPQNVGFLQGLSDTGIQPGNIEKLMSPFDKMLPIPTDIAEARHYSFWFTRAGLAVFLPHILRIREAAQRKNWDLMMAILSDADERLIVYQDKYQAALDFQPGADNYQAFLLQTLRQYIN